MANIRLQKSGNWNVQVRVAGKPARSQTFHTQKEAKAWATKQESMNNFRHPTLEEAGLQYCGSILAEKPSRNLTELQFKRIGKRPEFAKPLDIVTLQDVNAYKEKRLNEVSGTTVRDDLMVSPLSLTQSSIVWCTMLYRYKAPCSSKSIRFPR